MCALIALLDEDFVHIYQDTCDHTMLIKTTVLMLRFISQSSLFTTSSCCFRIVSRGKISSQASDFGGLEVFGGASIGHTDPFSIAAAYRRQIG